jgi:cytoplasmic iron level regulating protein YaaA (DUF328/UPF0246 family)
MLIVVSPAKTLDYESPLVTPRFTQPELLDHSAALISRARQLSPDQIATLMKISDKLAGLNAARFAEWQQISPPPMPVRHCWLSRGMSTPVWR